MKKQPEVTAITKGNIVSAFWKLYQKKRIEHISVKEIIVLAGYNRSTFYEYFTGVNDVLNYLEDTLLNDIKKVVIKDDDFLLDSNAIHKLAEIYDEKGEYLSVLLGENGDPRFVRKMKDIMKSITFSSFLVKEKPIAAYIAEFKVSAIIGTLTYWYQNKKNISSDEIITLIRSMLAKGTLQEIQKL